MNKTRTTKNREMMLTGKAAIEELNKILNK